MRFGGWCAAAACAPRPPHSVPEIGVGHISLLDCSQRVFSLVRSACSCNTLRNDRNMMNESDSDISRQLRGPRLGFMDNPLGHVGSASGPERRRSNESECKDHT